MKEPFDYSIVPYTFGLCAAEECPRATTCLRHIALEYAPAERVFLSIMNPKLNEKGNKFIPANEAVLLRQSSQLGKPTPLNHSNKGCNGRLCLRL